MSLSNSTESIKKIMVLTMSWNPISTNVPLGAALVVLNGGRDKSGSPLRTVPVRMKGVFPCCEAKYAMKLVKKTSSAFREVAINHRAPPNQRRLLLASAGVFMSFNFCNEIG